MRSRDPLRVPVDARDADWLVAGVSDFDYTVGALVPPVFAAYARVFHPAGRGSGEDEHDVRWSEVARANGRVMHPAAEWGSLAGSWQLSSQAGVWDSEPSQGELPRPLAVHLSRLLARHTSEPEHYRFGIWEGWGEPSILIAARAEASPDEVEHARQAAEAELAAWQAMLARAPRFQLPHRPMRLLEGPASAIGDLYDRRRSPPSVWWPADRAWCVESDVDLMTTYVGGSEAAIRTLLEDGEVEALPVTDDQRVTWDADTINPLPPPPN